jgi:hypothetical protein
LLSSVAAVGATGWLGTSSAFASCETQNWTVYEYNQEFGPKQKPVDSCQNINIVVSSSGESFQAYWYQHYGGPVTYCDTHWTLSNPCVLWQTPFTPGDWFTIWTRGSNYQSTTPEF